jgi:hypothetical protein
MFGQTLKAALLLLALATGLWAQESRGSITGTATDPQGGVIPNATVVITNSETNTLSRTATNNTGYFEINLLNPGTYSVSVEAAGFKKSLRTGLALQVAGHVDISVRLEIGQVAETIEVTAVTPLLDTTTASGGRVIDNREIVQLPFSDMNPFALTALSPGMQWTGQPEYRRPFDNGGTSSFNTMGGVGQNEYTIDGAPVTGTGRRVGFVPSSDAISEFKLETAPFDASYGHTSGATVNVVTKAGTNSYHGSLFDQHWQQRWNATPHFTRLQWESQVAQGKKKSSDQKQAPGRSNQFGGTLGGPMRIPKIYNGKDKLFFMFHYDGIYQTKAETTSSINRTVPKIAWRQGDFSDLLPIDATKYQIYDPRSATMANGRVTRMPFPGNKGIPILNSVYKYYLPFYPDPNNVPGLATPEGINNYYASAMPKNEKFNAMMNRWDYNISDRQRIFGRWYWNHRLADEYDWTYETRRGLHSNGLTRINKGAGGDYVWTIGNSTLLDLGASWTRFNEGSQNDVITSFKPSDVGLPKYIDDKAAGYKELPRMNFNNIESVSGGYPAITTRGTTGEVKLQMTTIKSSHSFKYGWSERRYWFTGAGPGDSSGSFSFDNRYMKQADNTTTASNTGLEWAAFMMGLPSGINISTNDTAYWSTRYRSLYFQDDWRLNNKLRLTLGLRYEREGGTTERYNRGLAGDFDPSYRPPFADAVETAYAKNAIPEMPASQFKVQGGVRYLGQPYKTYSDGTHHLLPRVGMVRQLGSKMVIRAGYGGYYDTFNVNNDRPSQDGFSQGTGTTLSNDNGFTFCCGLGTISSLSAANNPMVNPFPVRADGTRFNAPYGNSLGEIIRQGRGWTIRPRDFSPAWQQRWRVGFSRELRRDMAIEVSYNGAFSHTLLDRSLSFVPQQYWATGNTRNQAVDDNLRTLFPNPFNVSNFSSLSSSNPLVYNYLLTQGFFTGTTMSKANLIRAYQGMNGLGITEDRARNKYHDLEISFEKRMSKGISMAVMYTRAYDWVKDFYANEFDSEPSWRPQGGNVRPHRFVWQSIWELPFGRGRQLLTHGPLQHIVGGWIVSWIYQYQNGAATGWGNRYFYGDVNAIGGLLKHDQVHGKDIHMWFDPTIAYGNTRAGGPAAGSGPIPTGFNGFEGRSGSQAAGWQTRIFPTRLDVLREDGIRNWDVKIDRKFRITERLRTSFSVDLLNATNHTNFEGPNTDPTSTNFGRVDTQRGLSRVIQFNLRFEF